MTIPNTIKSHKATDQMRTNFHIRKLALFIKIEGGEKLQPQKQSLLFPGLPTVRLCSKSPKLAARPQYPYKLQLPIKKHMCCKCNLHEE
jgi:hypothetical protein